MHIRQSHDWETDQRDVQVWMVTGAPGEKLQSCSQDRVQLHFIVLPKTNHLCL